MKGKTEIEILKNAILLERQGKSFYETVAGNTKSPAAKKIFALMAQEEEKHVEYLSQHYKSVMEKGFFMSQGSYDNPEAFSRKVLTEEIKQEIDAASYEAAAISAAIEMEKKAIALYSGRAEETDQEDEKALYLMLTTWEKTHLDFLAELNKELTEEIWYENSFWPF